MQHDFRHAAPTYLQQPSVDRYVLAFALRPPHGHAVVAAMDVASCESIDIVENDDRTIVLVALSDLHIINKHTLSMAHIQATGGNDVTKHTVLGIAVALAQHLVVVRFTTFVLYTDIAQHDVADLRLGRSGDDAWHNAISLGRHIIYIYIAYLAGITLTMVQHDEDGSDDALHRDVLDVDMLDESAISALDGYASQTGQRTLCDVAILLPPLPDVGLGGWHNC